MLMFLAACALAPRPPEPATQAAVVAPGDHLPRVAPHGQATIWPLSEGAHAFVGRLELEPGATLPPHRDETDEVIVVLAGSGTLTLDGVEHPVGPGTAITMPAGAEVSFRNGVQRLVALQVFAGPGPAAKYEGWTALESVGPGLHAIGAVEPFVVTCSSPDCTIWYQGEAVGDPFWHYGDPENVLRPLGGPLPTFGKAWLLSKHAGDGCPVVYEALCLVDGAPVRTEPFGNCVEPVAARLDGRKIVLTFEASGPPDDLTVHRRAQVVSVDPRTCELHADPVFP